MNLLARRALCFGLVTSGCAITALVGENPDAGFAIDAVVAPPSDAGAPSDVVTAIDVVRVGPDVVDAPPLIEGLGVDRDVSGVALPDSSPLEAGSIATPDRDAGAGSEVGAAPDAPTTGGIVSPVRDASADDAHPIALDVPPGAACRRDAECVADPAGPFCSLLTMRCGPSR